MKHVFRRLVVLRGSYRHMQVGHFPYRFYYSVIKLTERFQWLPSPWGKGAVLHDWNVIEMLCMIHLLPCYAEHLIQTVFVSIAFMMKISLFLPFSLPHTCKTNEEERTFPDNILCVCVYSFSCLVFCFGLVSKDVDSVQFPNQVCRRLADHAFWETSFNTLQDHGNQS